jgi:hypothetical protein
MSVDGFRRVVFGSVTIAAALTLSGCLDGTGNTTPEKTQISPSIGVKGTPTPVVSQSGPPIGATPTAQP